MNRAGPKDMEKIAVLSTPTLITAALGLAALYTVSLYNFLLFHVLVEVFSVIVAFAIFMFAWNTRMHIRNGGFVVIGAAYLYVGAFDLLHALSFKGMGVFDIASSDTATQLWVAARCTQAMALAAAPLFAARRPSMSRAVAVCGALFAAVVAAIFIWPVFPACYVEGAGLTPFKKIGEYAIAAVLLAALTLLRRRRIYYDEAVHAWLAASIVIAIAAELMFTFYVNLNSTMILIGHFFKLASFWLIYMAILQTGLRQPYALLFRELAASEARYRELVDTLPAGVCEFDADFRLTYINPAGLRLFGYDPGDIQPGLNLEDFIEVGDQDKAQRRRELVIQGRSIGSTEYKIHRKDGRLAEVIVNSVPIYRNGQLSTIQASFTDVTEINRLKAYLQQGKKMEAITLLAGGMAHEVNNALTGIIGRIELIQLKAARHKVPDADFTDVLTGCRRITELIKQLLAYSRKGRYQNQQLDPAKFVSEALADLRDRLGPRIRLIWDVAPGLPSISADPMQLKMVVTEIVENAADALAGAGDIEIGLRLVTVNEAQAQGMPGMRPGPYVRLTARDNGKGMDAATLANIFEPFFSDKFIGRGLGMAAVYGVVKSHEGWVGVDSAPGRGTTVQVYLPVSEDSVAAEGLSDPAPGPSA